MLYEYSIHRIFSLLVCVLVIMSGTYAHAAEGGISLKQTRVIIDADSKSESITLVNRSKRVYLILSSVHKLPDGARESPLDIPFMIIPPLFRLESESTNTLMVLRKDTSKLPDDRESIFYLSFLAIPAVSKPENGGIEDGLIQPRVSIGIRSVIKLFYRPAGLVTSVRDAPGELSFQQQGTSIYTHNPTPYFMTLTRLKINGESVDMNESGAMIAPYSSIRYRFSDTARDVSWSVINDYGGVSRTYKLSLKGK